MVAVTCVAGDSHVFGAELLAQYLDGDGWTSLFLGASMPQRDLLEMIAGKRPYAAIVSIRMAAFLPAFKDLADALRGTVPAMLLLAGGTPRIAPLLTRLCDGVPATFAEAQAMLEKGPHRA
jgi:methanogenic corrinoid protein MtbC1